MVLIGLDGAGKTSLTLLLKSGGNTETAAHTLPTIGFNVEIVKPVKGAIRVTVVVLCALVVCGSCIVYSANTDYFARCMLPLCH